MLDDWCMAQRGLKKRLFMKLAGRRYLHSAACVHTTAEGEREQATKWIPKAKITVLPLLVDLAEYDTLPGPGPALAAFSQLATDAPKALFLSRLHPKKGVEALLRATADLARGGFRCELFIAGPGEEDYVSRLKRLAKELDLAGQAHFLGMVRGVQKTSLYQSADLFVLPTHQENFGLVLVEALACGTPVITTKGVDIWPELEQAGSAIVSAEPKRIAAAMHERLSHREKLPEIGERGRAFVRDWLAEEKVIASYEAMYADAARTTLT
jgi:glycosyltransferase involved in cell wall biosynthesis